MSDSFATPWTVARQASLSVGFPRKEYWSGLPFPPPGDLSNPRTEPASLMSSALAGGNHQHHLGFSHALMSAFCKDCLECSAPGIREWVFKGESRNCLAWEGDTGNPCSCVWNSENVHRQLFVKRTVPVMGPLNKSVTCLLLFLKLKNWL